MKKLAMLTVKGAIALVPKAVRNKLKKNHKLTEFYSHSLQRSGLFYGIPSKKKRAALYRDYLKHQEKTLKSLGRVSDELSDLYIVILGNEDVERTLLNLASLNIGNAQTTIVTKKTLCGDVQSVSSLNTAVKSLSNAGYTFFLNSGETLTPQSLELMMEKRAKSGITYCDTDFETVKGQLISPNFLSGWNPDLQLSSAYVSTGVLVDNTLLKKSVFRAETIAGMVSEIWLRNKELSVVHVPFTLLHRRQDRHVEAEVERLEDIGEVLKVYRDATPELDKNLVINHIYWPIVSEPLVSLIIPTKNGKALVKACIESILNKTSYQNYEILLIDNGSDDKDSLEYFEHLSLHPKIQVLQYPGEFNYSAINNFGAKQVSENSAIIGLINNDIEVISSAWLTNMVSHALREDVGCVGAKLIYSDGRIQHAGVILGYGGGAGHAHKFFPRTHPGYMKRLVATQNFSAVTAACLLVKRSLFNVVEGLNEADLAVAFNDVDFCLRVLQTGVRNVYCAEAELYHHESISRGHDHAPEKAARFNRELSYLKKSWADYISNDPAYSPNLTLRRENFSIKSKDEF